MSGEASASAEHEGARSQWHGAVAETTREHGAGAALCRGHANHEWLPPANPASHLQFLSALQKDINSSANATLPDEFWPPLCPRIPYRSSLDRTCPQKNLCQQFGTARPGLPARVSNRSPVSTLLLPYHAY